MNKLRRTALTIALGLLVFTAAVFAGSTVRRAIAVPPPPPVLPVAERTDDAVHFTAALTGQAAAEVRRHGSTSEETLVVALAEKDVTTCEDMGRQIRELHRAFGAERPFLVMASPADANSVRAFLNFERIGRGVLVETSDGPLFSDGTRPQTPAAMVVLPSGEITAGVSHLSSAPNLRLHSFADQLGLREDGADRRERR